MNKPKTSKIYTKAGDHGRTFCPGALRGSGNTGRVAKNDPQIEALGSIDELNSLVGLALSRPGAANVAAILLKIQSDLLILGAEIAASPLKSAATDMVSAGSKKGAARSGRQTPLIRDQKITVTNQKIAILEKNIDQLSAELPVLNNFILPGGTPRAAGLHVARAVARRAERRCAAIKNILRPQVLAYLNRLSDVFFVLARFENYKSKIGEKVWPGGSGQKNN